VLLLQFRLVLFLTMLMLLLLAPLVPPVADWPVVTATPFSARLMLRLRHLLLGLSLSLFSSLSLRLLATTALAWHPEISNKDGTMEPAGA
jgi:hypothetical protein